MPFIADYALDAGIEKIREGTRIDICSQEPVSYTEATSTYTLGNKTGLSLGAVADRSPSGRKTTVPAITDGTTTGTDDGSHWALTDPGNSRLLATGALASPQAMTSGNPFTLTAFDIGIPDAA